MNSFAEFTLDVTSKNLVCHPGMKRPHQEDSCDIWLYQDLANELKPLGGMYVVADGVGGATAGGQASSYAVEKVMYDYYRETTGKTAARLRAAIRTTNKQIFYKAKQNQSGKGMGTTLVCAVIKGSNLFVANVGDSRAYRLRGSQVVQITKDHSLMQQLLDTGDLRPEETSTFRKKNVLIRCLGAEENVHVDIFEQQVQEGDTIILCSDGFHNYLQSQDELLGLVDVDLRANDISEKLISLANERGGADNISVLVIKVLGIGVALAEDELATVFPRRSMRSPGKFVPEINGTRTKRTNLRVRRILIRSIVVMSLLIAGYASWAVGVDWGIMWNDLKVISSDGEEVANELSEPSVSVATDEAKLVGGLTEIVEPTETEPTVGATEISVVALEVTPEGDVTAPVQNKYRINEGVCEYTVPEGGNLTRTAEYSLGIDAGVDDSRLAERIQFIKTENKLSSDNLQKGQKLYVPWDRFEQDEYISILLTAQNEDVPWVELLKKETVPPCP